MLTMPEERGLCSTICCDFDLLFRRGQDFDEIFDEIGAVTDGSRRFFDHSGVRAVARSHPAARLTGGADGLWQACRQALGTVCMGRGKRCGRRLISGSKWRIPAADRRPTANQWTGCLRRVSTVVKRCWQISCNHINSRFTHRFCYAGESKDGSRPAQQQSQHQLVKPAPPAVPQPAPSKGEVPFLRLNRLKKPPQRLKRQCNRSIATDNAGTSYDDSL